MAVKPMYPGSPYSPQTTLAASIGAADTSITLADASILPVPPNYITIGSAGDANCETVLYQVRTGNTLSGLTRGVEGAAASHNAGDPVGSYITAALINTIIDNVNGAFDEIGTVGDEKEPKFTDASEKTVAFTAATERTALSSGETLKVLFGKLLKWLSDLKAAAFAEIGMESGKVAPGDHTHSQYLTAETDPSVPAWAKAASKPSYTASEVGADPTGTASTAVSTHNAASDAHGTLFAAKMPLKTSGVTLTASTTLALTHAEKMLLVNASSAVTITIPTHASVAFPVGTLINITGIGTGTVTLAPASGVTLYTKDSALSIDGQYGAVTLYKASDNVWYGVGALA